ncbi:hypothetical protein GH741_02130 [Aquibacillus halophilus]|uniref:Putative zinc-finger domain-containing protein n=1 Tax=Aquibacillus halophilus TaxID=930132 RepID=A0A6A8DC74_9BACI|nr:zf-HC2 domain-containing protein [Aquibacillus halophilus]MRH41469.1 hypothetical protein [Aquibacillus halophilus]
MKLDHAVVKDLYPVYIENELSPEVKQAVEEHLQICEGCRNSYETGEGFFDQLKEIVEPEAPISMDEKLLLKVKLNRLKWVAFLLIGIILSMVITDYKNDREKLFLALTDYYSTQRHLPDLFEVVKNEEYSDLDDVHAVVHQFFENKIALEEHFNFIEKRSLNNTTYYLSMNTSRFTNMLEVMKYRYDHGLWSETDEAAYQQVQQYFNHLNQVMTEEYKEMHHGYSSYFETLNVKEMDEFYESINELSDSYTRFHKLSEQLHPLEKMELNQKVANIIETDMKAITLEKESPLNEDPYTYNYRSKGDYSGLIDGITGQILELHGNHELTSGPIMSEEEAEETAKDHLEKIYGDEVQFDLVSLGFNYNYSANDSRFKVYSYRLVPYAGEYRLYSPFERGTILHLDARTGDLNMFHHNPHVPNFDELNQTELDIEVSKKTLQEKGLNVSETVIIYSALSGEFELVHMDSTLEDFEEGKYYSAETGNEEWIYFNDR